MLKFLKQPLAAGETAEGEAEDGSAATASDTSSKSRLNALQEKKTSKTTKAFDENLLTKLSVSKRGVDPEQVVEIREGVRSKRPRLASASSSNGISDITLSGSSGRKNESSRDSEGVSDRFGRYNGAYNTHDGYGNGNRITNNAISSDKKKASATTTSGTTSGSSGRRQISGVSLGEGGSSSYARNGPTVSHKMGPWMQRPGETAICAEGGYDPLGLIHNANQEIFGNYAFRGVQEDVRFWEVGRGGGGALSKLFKFCDTVVKP